MNTNTLTLDTESVTITKDGIIIQPTLSDRFLFNGNVDELISIMIAHPELDITRTLFRVRENECGFCRGLCDGIHYVSPSTIGY